MSDALNASAGILLSLAALAALRRWGLEGLWEMQRTLIWRLAHGPDPKPIERPDYDRIAELERELGLPETSRKTH